MTSNKSVTNAWKDFPCLSQKIAGRGFAYLDSAATTLKPWPVIERVSRFLSFETANVHRGAYHLSDQATQNFEHSRKVVQNFIGAQSEAEIIFTKGTTDSVNLVASSLESLIQAGDAILVTELEHHSNFVPWQQLALRKKAKFLMLPTNEKGELDLEQYQQWLQSHQVKLVALTAMSNALGVLPPIQQMIQMAHQQGALVLIDAAQAISFLDIDVKTWNCEFLVFSGHKLFAPYGVGVCFIKQSIQSQLLPYQFGGSMVDRVSYQQTTFLSAPHGWEAGTPNIEGVIGLAEAIRYIQQFDSQAIRSHETSLTQQAYQLLSSHSNIKIFGQPEIVSSLLSPVGPIISFIVKGTHASDVAHIFNQENVFVRSGHHCCQPLMDKLQVGGTLRVSFSIYNTPKDIERLENALNKVKDLLL